MITRPGHQQPNQSKPPHTIPPNNSPQTQRLLNALHRTTHRGIEPVGDTLELPTPPSPSTLAQSSSGQLTRHPPGHVSTTDAPSSVSSQTSLSVYERIEALRFWADTHFFKIVSGMSVLLASSLFIAAKVARKSKYEGTFSPLQMQLSGAPRNLQLPSSMEVPDPTEGIIAPYSHPLPVELVENVQNASTTTTEDSRLWHAPLALPSHRKFTTNELSPRSYNTFALPEKQSHKPEFPVSTR